MQDYEKIKKFWDKRAKKYPLPYDESVYPRTLSVLEKIKKVGCSFKDKYILEIGSGTGVYTLPIAKEAKKVVAVDPSDEMLKILKEQTMIYDVVNIETYKNFWHEIDIDRTGFRKKFDIVLSAMTPAIKTLEDIIKMENCSKKWCIYIGWGRKRENTIKSEIFKFHGVDLKPPSGVLMIQNILNEKGRKPHIEFYETSWQWKGSIEEALDDISGFLELQNIKPNKEKILEILNKHFPDGKVVHTTYAEHGILIWEV
ncbi:MAG: class I SAM-dependent methyltransferase [Thermodesulfovibrio sp.]|nr:class I SAM-dependent methyltransferase [Thermodesulfovibrio sp.]